jgi:hypothetical protein
MNGARMGPFQATDRHQEEEGPEERSAQRTGGEEKALVSLLFVALV